MKKRIFEIDLVSNLGKNLSNKYSESVETLFISDQENLTNKLDESMVYFDKKYGFIPTDILIISKHTEPFRMKMENWRVNLFSDPCLLVSNDNGHFECVGYVFTYSHFLNRKNLVEWLISESEKINPIQISLVETVSERVSVELENPKIYDCFVFNDEFQILDLRLKLLDDKVDKFILVESKQTHSGKLKPAFFDLNKHLYEKYSDKISHIVIEKFPNKILYPPSEIDVPKDLHVHWFRENFQRNEILKSLHRLNLDPEDIILISDLDEIPDPQKLDTFLNSIPDDDYGFQLQKWCIWDFDRYHNGFWPGTAAVRWKTLLKTTPQEIRRNRYSSDKLHTDDVYGWHCSWFGGIDVVMNKLSSFAHQELRDMKREDVENKMTMNLDIHGHQLIFDKEGYRPII
jgi:beta-1,4-mannosyl-glycoprotein beta-1,4-N-acetylglucosaminyltransferase